MKNDDEAIFDNAPSGWRKKQIQQQLFPIPPTRNEVLEEVAKEIEKMTVFGKDTVSSFATYIREMKQ